MKNSMGRNRRMAVIIGGLCAVAAGSSAILTNARVGNYGDALRGFFVGITLVLAVAFLVKSRQYR